MKYSRLTHIALLIAAMQMVSGYYMRCWFLCEDQSAIQHSYVDDRDLCRTYSQLRIDTDTSNPELLEERQRKAKLVTLFSACMAERGWTIPDGKYSQQASNPIPVPNPTGGNQPVMLAHSTATLLTSTPPSARQNAGSSSPAPAGGAGGVAMGGAATAPPQSAAAIAAAQRERAFLARSTECAFARHSAANSSTAAARAAACDIECAERQKAAPDAPRPAACPADPSTLSPTPR